jgi:uncharacterized SAM-binding protein YcdF (DUF218 family)
MLRLRRAAARVVIGFVVLLLFLHVTPVVPAITDWLTDDWQEPKGDILIVLGAEQLGDGMLGISSYWRSVYAVRAWRLGGFQRLLVTAGGQGHPQAPSLAAAMRDFMVGLGIPASAILLEERSRSTRENALYSAEILRHLPGRKVLLTSDCHMRRARRAFARAGVETVPVPVPDVRKRWNAWINRWECIWTVGVELTKYGYYRARGWI